MASPEQIGPYQILGVLGRGGMGVVYRALQTEPLRREVALKTVAIGLDSDAVLARFEHERQALARMSHPSVANVYDAGLTDDGVPYFAMEYVDGTTLLEYCDDRRLDVETRLDLFLQVCSAVHHAHQKGVIHRDLKPGNVLVTEVDGAPLCKVIDFGIATAADPPDAERARLTGIDEVLGTPAYMSPEQIDGAGDVDTRADVYALGVVMYELLAGVLPLTEDRYRGWAAYSSALTEDPPPPSQRLSDLDDTQRTVADARGLDAAGLRRRLRGDLDWIVARALEKQRDERYASVQALAQDIERHLADEPVSAGPPGAAYRLRKFVRRNRPLVIGAAAVVAVLLGGIATTAAGLVRARAAEAEARTEAATAREISDFLIGLFQAGDPGAEGRSDVLAREILDRGVESVEADLADQPDVQGRLLLTMAQAYRGLAMMGPSTDLAVRSVEVREAALGRTAPELVEHLAFAADVFPMASSDPERVAAEDPYVMELVERIREIGLQQRESDPELYRQTLGTYAWWLQKRGRMAEGEALMRAEIERLDRSGDEAARSDLVALLGNIYMNDGRRAEAAEAWEAALESLPTDARQERLNLANNLAMAYGGLGRQEEAVAMFEQNLAMERELAESDLDLRLHDALFNLAAQYQEVEMWDEAADAMAQLVAIQDAAWGETSPFVPHTISNHAWTLLEAGRPDEADSVAAVAAARIEPFLSDDRFGPQPWTTWSMNTALQLELARRLGRSARLDTVLAKLPEDVGERWRVTRELGWSLQDWGHLDGSREVLDISDEALARWVASDPSTPADLVRDHYYGLAHHALETDDEERLRQVAARWPEMMTRVEGDGTDEHVLQARRESARVLAIGDPFREIAPVEAARPYAVPVLEAILADRRRDLAPDDPGLLTHIAPLVLVHHALGDDAAAAGHRAAASALVVVVRARFDADGVEDSGAWNEVCWWGALAGAAADALPACDRAIELASEENLAGHRDSRGLARALVGDTEGALADFRAYVEARPPGHEMAGVRDEWIAAFEAGRNPLDFLTLADIAM
jgi:tetratricopeptide (TPR) repeat protein